MILAGRKRHGGVLELSDAEYERLIKAEMEGNMLYPQENKIRGIIDLNRCGILHLGQRRNRGCGDIAGADGANRSSGILQ